MKLLLLAIVALAFMGLFMNKPTEQLQEAAITGVNGVPLTIQQQYAQYLINFGKNYNGDEYNYRLMVYYENMQQIDYENSIQSDYVLGETQFTDLTKEEFVSIYLGTLPQTDASEVDAEYTVNAAQDWRQKGAVQRVKNQGQCGSCWAFSAIATVEGYSKLVKGTLGDFSEQQLVDCSKDNYGCNGGWPNKALNYVKANGISTQSEYPYVGKDQACKKTGGAFKIGSVRSNSGCASLTSDLATQPTSVCVDASNWSSYRSGIFSNCGTSTNHAVLAVGYDDAGNWIIKNSWGTTWGEQGYIRLKAGNTCNVCSALANAL